LHETARRIDNATIETGVAVEEPEAFKQFEAEGWSERAPT
jgi:hypothetical protein